MSVPQAHQAVSEKPGPLDVNKATNAADKERDVKRKLKVYEAIKAIQAGYLPTNAQVDKVLHKALDHHLVKQSQLSPASRQIEEDVNDVLQTLRDMIKSKNEDEIIQRFLNETKGPKLDPTAKDVPVDKQQAKEDAATAARHLRVLLSLFVSNADIRKVLFDVGLVGRELLAASAVKAAEKIRPTDEQLRSVDKEASLGERPSFRPPSSEPRTSAGGVASEAKEGYSQAQAVKDDTKGTALSTAHEAVQAAKEQRTSEFVGNKEAQLQEAKDDLPTPTSPKTEERRTFKERYRGLKERFGPSDDDSDKYRAQKARAESFLEEHFPEERRDQFIYRLKKAVVAEQQREEYDEAISSILDILETYKGHAGALKTTSATSASEIAADPGFQRSWTDLKDILTRLAGRPLDGVIAAVDQLYVDAKHDEELRVFWSDANGYVRKALLEPGYIVEEQCAADGRALRERFKSFYDHKYATHKDHLFDEVSFWLKGFSEDPLNARLGTDIQRLAKDLLFDPDGSLVYKSEIFEDFKQVVLPTLIDQVGYIPIPRIEFQDRQVDLVIENLVLRGETLFPNFVDIETSWHTRFSPTKPSAVGKGANRARAVIQLSQIQADLRDVNVSFAKKTGFPKLKDAGIADCLIGGEGISATIVLESSPSGSQSLFTVRSVKAHVGTLKVAIRHSSHDFAYKVILPLVTGLIKRNIAHSLESSIKSGLAYVDTQLYSVRSQVKEAGSKPGASKVDAFSSLLSKKKAEGEEAAGRVEAKAEDTQAHVTIGEPVKMAQPIQPAPQQATYLPRDAAQAWKSPAFDF